MAIQATLASIRAPEIHEVIITHERAAVDSRDSEEPGQSLLILLGIEEWFTIYNLAQSHGTSAALGKLEDFYALLFDMEINDALELEKAGNVVSAVVAALLLAEEKHGAPGTRVAAIGVVMPDTQNDLCNSIKENPLLDTKWLTPEEQAQLSQALDTVNSSQSATSEECFEGEPFVPVLPPRYIEWEVSAVDGSLIQGRLVLLIKFLSGDARKMVLDQISFIYLRQFMTEAAMELVAHPEERFLTKYGDSKGIRTIEALFKPGSFSDKTEKLAPEITQTINLNTTPKVAPRRKGLFANNTPCTGRGRGFGRGVPVRRSFVRSAGNGRPLTTSAYCTPIGASNSHFAVNIGTVNNETHVAAEPVAPDSPLQRRNIQFQFL
ncbi:unnamed protein product [Calypogeia fissa]